MANESKDGRMAEALRVSALLTVAEVEKLDDCSGILCRAQTIILPAAGAAPALTLDNLPASRAAFSWQKVEHTAPGNGVVQ